MSSAEGDAHALAAGAVQGNLPVLHFPEARAFALWLTVHGMLGGPPLFVEVEGFASLIEDKATFADHWTKDLDRYFPEGIDTPGVVMIQVQAESIRYWDGGHEGTIIP
ncbi:pyridoxamine 5'-phosphate oxidase family protein [Lichenihabitans sp. PAMC28606]|uniref:pyridoxamine 5'-phosphate oxidase family protein n=1 Tax=Lichenihabitans sp. PAMC28606 TaxID=2880932 RepID=UPI0039B59C6A